MKAPPRRKRKPAARLYGLGTALPAHAAGQEIVLRFMKNLAGASVRESGRARALDFLDRLYAASGIRRRHSVLADYLAEDPSQFAFYPKNWGLDPFPSTAARMEVYENEAVGLAERAARAALAESGLAPGEVTHLLVSTCTGLFAPGPDILLAGRLGLSPSVRRVVIGFMGCYAGFSGMRLAEEILAGNPEAAVLHVCVELCSLHFQKKALPDFMVANSLFADGAAACLWAAPGRLKGGLGELLGTRSLVAADSLEQMSWRIGPEGFEMRLDRKVPESLRAEAPGFAEALLGEAGLDRRDVTGWAVHPGGRRIVEEVQGALSLDDRAVASAYGVLEDCGNMSSPTIFFVLDRELRGPARGPVAALGFGPGLTVEGAVLARN